MTTLTINRTDPVLLGTFVKKRFLPPEHQLTSCSSSSFQTFCSIFSCTVHVHMHELVSGQASFPNFAPCNAALGYISPSHVMAPLCSTLFAHLLATALTSTCSKIYLLVLLAVCGILRNLLQSKIQKHQYYFYAAASNPGFASIDCHKNNCLIFSFYKYILAFEYLFKRLHCNYTRY